MNVRSVQEDLILELLTWLGDEGRSYAEVMERWRTSCPRLSIWEDAIAMRLVRSMNPEDVRGERVVLTAEGREALAKKQLGP